MPVSEPLPVRIRSTLDRIQPYVPGTPIEVVMRRTGIEHVVKLASNETPFAPLPSVVEAIARAAADVNRYPDDDATALRNALAARYEVWAEQVAVGCGSLELCLQAVLATSGPGDEVAYCSPSFVAYPLFADLVGATRVEVPLVDLRYHAEGLAAAVTDRTRVVFVANPNNPTGTAITRAELERLLAAVPPDCLVVLDEAYREYVADDDVPDGLDYLASHPNLLVLRTFSKAYGLAGLRVGYGIGHPGVLAELRKTHLTFGVNSLALAAAEASLAPEAQAELDRRVADVVSARRGLADALGALGLAVTPSYANFLFVGVPGRAAVVAAALESRGVIVRPMGPDALRITVGTVEENDRLCRELRAVLGS